MSTYEDRPGNFTLRKNDRKTQENQPDYKGLGVDLDGKPIWISAWIKQGKNGTFMSCSMQPRDAVAPPQQPPKSSYQAIKDGDEDIPF